MSRFGVQSLRRRFASFRLQIVPFPLSAAAWAATLLRPWKWALLLPAPVLLALAIVMISPGGGPATATGANSIQSPDTNLQTGLYTSLQLDSTGNLSSPTRPRPRSWGSSTVMTPTASPPVTSSDGKIRG